MGGVISAVSKVVEKVKDVAEGVKSALSHGASALGCLMKGDIPGAMGQVQAGCMDCLKATQAAMVPGLTFRSQGSQMGTMGFNPWSMLGGGTNQQALPMPPMGMMGMGGGFGMMGGMGMPQGLPMGGMMAMGMPQGMPMPMMGAMPSGMPMMQPLPMGGAPSMQIGPGMSGSAPPGNVTINVTNNFGQPAPAPFARLRTAADDDMSNPKNLPGAHGWPNQGSADYGRAMDEEILKDPAAWSARTECEVTPEMVEGAKRRQSAPDGYAVDGQYH